MSAIGPRPERPEFVEELAREIPFYRVRQCVAYPKGAPSSPAWPAGPVLSAVAGSRRS